MKYLSTLAWPPNPGHKESFISEVAVAEVGVLRGQYSLFPVLTATFGSPKTSLTSVWPF